MNQLMLELYQQALEFAYKNISKESWNTDNFHAVVSGKFAELIVRECVEQLNISNVPATVSAGLNLGKMAIKQHFGVT